MKALEEEGSVCDLAKIVKKLALSERSQRKSLKSKLDSLEKNGLIQMEGSRLFLVKNNGELVVGVVSSHPRGFAFLIPDKGEGDTFLPPREAKKVLDGDKILVRLVTNKSKNRIYGRVIKVIEPRRNVVVGRYIENFSRPMLEPVGSSLKFPIRLHLNNNSPQVGELVSAELVRTSKGTISSVATIQEVIGVLSDKEMPFKMSIVNHSIPVKWSEQVLREVRQVPSVVKPNIGARRTNMREYPFVTIDGIDAKDFDDAVYAERVSEGFSLYVAIADVSAYVGSGGAIDQEAFERGNSVYFSQTVVPMLPEALSNNICSLIPNEDRLALVAQLEINEDGELQNYKFFEAVINSKERLSYDQVQCFFDGNHADKNLSFSVSKNLTILKKVYQSLRHAREDRFALEVDSAENFYRFNGQGRIEEITSEERSESQKVIEECMIIANVAAAKFCESEIIPYRTHPKPDTDKLEKLREEAKKIGVTTEEDLNNPAQLCNSALRRARGREDRILIEAMVMRSQKLASYSASEKEHFGLALFEYTHFTSPIRRYSDLMVHRAIKKKIGKGPGLNGRVNIETVSLQCSRCERRAEDATREELSYLKCEFMERRIGANYSAIVTGIVDFGAFVQILSNSIDGFLPLDRQFSTNNQGKHSSGGLFLGQSITVVVDRVDMTERRVYFNTTHGESGPQKGKR